MNKISARSTALSVLLAAPLLMVAAPRARADDLDANVSLRFHAGDADVGVFYDSLAPYGDWVDSDRYGQCWAPRRIEQDWRPYYYGHWVFTDDYGWMWVGDEEWGWAAYHYGRWAFDPAYGWIWVPGSVWAPAWVSWRYGGGYAGWAPLPPDVDPSMGPANFGIDPLSYVFVEERYLPEPVLVDRYVPPARNVTIVHATRNVTDYRVVNNQVVNHGVPVQTVERVTGRAVPRVRVAAQTAPARTAVRGNEVAIYRPPVPKAPAGGARAAAPRPGTTAQRPPAATQHPTGPITTTQRPPAATQHPTGPITTTQRPPAAAQPSPTDLAELQRRHAQEQQALAAKEAQEREKLRQIQEREKAAPPPNVSQQQLEKQHQEEQKAQAEHEQRQKQAQEHRQARERQAAQQQGQQQRPQQQGQQQHPQAKNDKEKKKPQDKQ